MGDNAAHSVRVPVLVQGRLLAWRLHPCLDVGVHRRRLAWPPRVHRESEACAVLAWTAMPVSVSEFVLAKLRYTLPRAGFPEESFGGIRPMGTSS